MRHIVLATAYHRLGRADEARKEIVEAGRLASTIPWDSMILAGREVPPRSLWHDWLGYNLLRREAEALILDPAFPADPFERWGKGDGACAGHVVARRSGRRFRWVGQPFRSGPPLGPPRRTG
jgi:hypothetical protein